MDEILQIPEILTYVSYLVLGGLAMWVIAHALKIFDSFYQEGPNEWKEQVREISVGFEADSAALEKKVKELSRLREKIFSRTNLNRKVAQAKNVAAAVRAPKQSSGERAELIISKYPEYKEDPVSLVKKIIAAESVKEAGCLVLFEAAEVLSPHLNPDEVRSEIDRAEKVRELEKKADTLCRKISERFKNGPVNGLSAWLQDSQRDLDQGVLRVIRSSENEFQDDVRGDREDPSVREWIRQESSPWRVRFGIPTVAAPAAGAAPTMSGTMAFLRDYTDSIEEGSMVPSMVGLNDALLTTWIGCTLTVVSVVLLAIVVGRIQSRWKERKKLADMLLKAYLPWKKIVLKGEASLEGLNV